MDRTEYTDKSLVLLNDSYTYKLINRDPTHQIQYELNKSVDEIFLLGLINLDSVRILKCTNGYAPKYYGLPKIQKPDCPLCPVTLFVGSPLYDISGFIAKPIKAILGNTSRHVISDLAM